jgi:uncharacterized protein YkwD
MRRLLAVLCVALPAHAIADVAAIVNGVRADSCHRSSDITAPLRREPRLDEAAQRIAGGADLESATAAADYPAKLSASIRARTLQSDGGLAQILSQRFCDIVGDAQLTEIGAYEQGAEIWIVFATPFAPPASVDPADLDREVFELINEARLRGANCGRRQFAATAALQRNDALDNAAQLHAQDMAQNNFLAHEGSSGSMPGNRATNAGFTWSAVGENVAAGQSTAREVVDTWLASTGHCENLMDPAYTATGVAHAVNNRSDKGIYWVQIFGVGP